MTIWRMRLACWITKATNRHSEHVILIVFHGNNGYAIAPHSYVVPTFPAFFNAGMSRTEHRRVRSSAIKETPSIMHTRANPALTWTPCSKAVPL